MKFILFVIILVFDYSFEKHMEEFSLLESNENKKYTIKEDAPLKKFKLDYFLGNGDSKTYKNNGNFIYVDKLEYDIEEHEIKIKVIVYG